MSVKSIYLIFGSEKFQNIINDWFSINKDIEINKDILNIDHADSQIESFINNTNHIKIDNSILSIIEQVFILIFNGG